VEVQEFCTSRVAILGESSLMNRCDFGNSLNIVCVLEKYKTTWIGFFLKSLHFYPMYNVGLWMRVFRIIKVGVRFSGYSFCITCLVDLDT
jgi:hypothetical protein